MDLRIWVDTIVHGGKAGQTDGWRDRELNFSIRDFEKGVQ